MSSSLIKKILILCMFFWSFNAWTSENCPFALVRFQVDHTIHVGLLKGLEWAPNSMKVADITEFLRNQLRMKTAPMGDLEDRVLNAETYEILNDLSCQWHTSGDKFFSTFPSIRSVETNPNTTYLPLGIDKPRIKYKAPLSGRKLLLFRASVPANTTINLNNIQEYVAGISYLPGDDLAPQYSPVEGLTQNELNGPILEKLITNLNGALVLAREINPNLVIAPGDTIAISF